MKTLKTTIDEIAAHAESLAPEHMTDGRMTREWLEAHGKSDNLQVNVEWVDRYITNDGMTTLDKVVHIIQDQLRPAVTDIDDIYGDTVNTFPGISNWTMDVERGEDFYRCTECFFADGRYHSPVTIVRDTGLSYFENREVIENMFFESVRSAFYIPTKEILTDASPALSVWMNLFGLNDLKDLHVTFPDEISYWDAIKMVKWKIMVTYKGLVGDAPLALEVAAMTARDIKENNYKDDVKVNDTLEYKRSTCKIVSGREASIVEVKSCPDNVCVHRTYVVWDGFLFDYDWSVDVYKALTGEDMLWKENRNSTQV